MTYTVTTFSKDFDMKSERESVSNLILRMLKKTDGSVNTLRKKFVRRAKNGCPKAAAYLEMLDQYETAEKERILKVLDDMQDGVDRRVAAQKKKYSILYPPVNI